MRTARLPTVHVLMAVTGVSTGGTWDTHPTGHIPASDTCWSSLETYPLPPGHTYALTSDTWWSSLETPAQCAQTDTCENITFPQLGLRVVKISQYVTWQC